MGPADEMLEPQLEAEYGDEEGHQDSKTDSEMSDMAPVSQKNAVAMEGDAIVPHQGHGDDTSRAAMIESLMNSDSHRGREPMGLQERAKAKMKEHFMKMKK